MFLQSDRKPVFGKGVATDLQAEQGANSQQCGSIDLSAPCRGTCRQEQSATALWYGGQGEAKGRHKYTVEPQLSCPR